METIHEEVVELKDRSYLVRGTLTSEPDPILPSRKKFFMQRGDGTYIGHVNPVDADGRRELEKKEGEYVSLISSIPTYSENELTFFLKKIK